MDYEGSYCWCPGGREGGRVAGREAEWQGGKRCKGRETSSKEEGEKTRRGTGEWEDEGGVRERG